MSIVYIEWCTATVHTCLKTVFCFSRKRLRFCVVIAVRCCRVTVVVCFVSAVFHEGCVHDVCSMYCLCVFTVLFTLCVCVCVCLCVCVSVCLCVCPVSVCV